LHDKTKQPKLNKVTEKAEVTNSSYGGGKRAPSVPIEPHTMLEEVYECENGCGFESTDINIVEKHEETCTFEDAKDEMEEAAAEDDEDEADAAQTVVADEDELCLGVRGRVNYKDSSGRDRFIEGTFVRCYSSTYGNRVFALRRDDGETVEMDDTSRLGAIKYYNSKFTGDVSRYQNEWRMRAELEPTHFSWAKHGTEHDKRWRVWAAPNHGIFIRHGWKIAENPRLNGTMAGHTDKYFMNPKGVKYRSIKEVLGLKAPSTSGTKKKSTQVRKPRPIPTLAVSSPKATCSSASVRKSVSPLAPSLKGQGVKKFYDFVHQRQEIWRKKKSGLPRAQWTKDKILSEGHFCNNYRELDRGTVYLSSSIREHRARAGRDHAQGSLEDLELVVWLVICYRRINLIETFIDWRATKKGVKKTTLQTVEGPPSISEWPSFLAFIKNRTGLKPVFTKAHICSGGFNSYVEDMEKLQNTLRDICIQLRSHTSTGGKVDLRLCFQVLKSLPGAGDFFAWQFLCDIIEAKAFPPHLEVDEDSFCRLGPGAKRGLILIGGVKAGAGDDECLKTAQRLTGMQDSVFKSLGVVFHRFNERKLTLKNIEHCLCEYQKYVSTGNIRRYKPYVTNTEVKVGLPSWEGVMW